MTLIGNGAAAGGAGPGHLIIVCGLPGSGKTTRALQLAVERGGVRFAPDEWMSTLGVNLWDSAMRERIESLQWLVAKDLLGLGVTVLIEWGTWGRSERDRLRDEARALGASVELCYLDVPLDELWRRIQARNAEEPPISRSDVDGWARTFQAPATKRRVSTTLPDPLTGRSLMPRVALLRWADALAADKIADAVSLVARREKRPTRPR